MSTLAWIVVFGFGMSALALVGGITTLMSERTLARLLMPLVALAAGSLLGGAFFHSCPGRSTRPATSCRSTSGSSQVSPPSSCSSSTSTGTTATAP